MPAPFCFSQKSDSKKGHWLKIQYFPAEGFSSSPGALMRTLTTHQVSGNRITNISCSRACVYSVLPTGHFPPHVTFSYHPESQDPDTSQIFQAQVWFGLDILENVNSSNFTETFSRGTHSKWEVRHPERRRKGCPCTLFSNMFENVNIHKKTCC